MILRILFFLVPLLLLPAWGIDRAFFRGRLSGVGRIAFFAPNVLLLVALAVMSYNESYTIAATQLKGQLLTLVLCIAIPELITALLLAFSPLLKAHPRRRKFLRLFAVAVGVLVFCLMVYGFTAGYRRIVVKEFEYASPAIPEKFDGYRIVQISDLHLGTLHGRSDVLPRIVDMVNAARPDLIAFTGDLVNIRAEEMLEFRAALSRMQAPDGVVSVMGNHDYMMYYRWDSEAERLKNVRLLQDEERRLGWQLLLNDNRVVRRDSDSIAIVGVENDGRPPFPALGNLSQAQSGLPDGCFRVLLSHDPSHWRRKVLRHTDIPLTLSGHTHGMQFKVGTFSPAAWFYPEWGGEYVENGQTLFVSLGTGEVMLPFRLGAWPEINVIILRKS